MLDKFDIFNLRRVDCGRVIFAALLILSSLASLGMTAVLLMATLNPSSLPEILERNLPGFGDFSFGGGKGEFMSRMTRQQEKEFAAHVHYVSEIIRNNDKKARDVKKLASLIVRESYYANSDPLFIAAVIKSESSFKNLARSYVGARGLMQIMPDTGKFISRHINLSWEGNAKLDDPQYNLRLGIAYLKHLEQIYRGNRERMLMAYNWGPANLAEGLKGLKTIPPVTRRYTNTIIRDHSHWKNTFEARKHEFRDGSSAYFAARQPAENEQRTL